jgi:hypothetical protein
MLPHELFIGRSSRRCRGGRETGHGSREAKGREGECPKEDESQESQGRCTRRNPATVCPNRRREKTPEARPLRQQCLQRRKRLAPRIRKGRVSQGSFEELVL